MHRLINDKVYVVSSTDEYFKGELGFPLDPDGRIANKYPTKQPWQLFEDGGAVEDDVPRWLNHYHDPTQALFYAGLKDSLLGYSNLEWAQFDGLNGWTWKRACDEFSTGLTASDSSVRGQALGNLFATLGRLTHLVADMASPAHVRDDAHPFFDGYEDWSRKRLTSLDNTIFEKPVFRRYEIPPDNAIYTMSIAYASRLGTVAYSPVSNLWDANPVAPDNVMAEWTRLVRDPTTVGLAEYSNYNYLSDDTVFTDYQYPRREEVGVWLVPRTARDGQTDYLLYFKRPASDGILVRYLAATDLVFLDQQAPLDNSLRYVAAHLDANCYEDYASSLVPRAVSYGMALVDYFFRGKFNVTSDGYTLTVTNLSRGTVDGLITIYADDANGVRTSVPGFADYPLTLAADNTMTLSGFNPSGSRNNQYTLVFRGRMQNTGPGGASTWDNVVAGKVFPWTPSALPDNIVVGANPHGLALAPNGRRLYVANTASSTVSVIDTATRQVTATINVGAGPVDVAVSPDSSRAFVSNEWDRSVSVIDTGNNQVVATITGLPPWPEELAVTPDGRFVYLAHWSFTPLTVIDSGSLAPRSYTSPANPCQGVALHPESPAAYLTYYTFYWRNAVAAVDRSSLGLIAAIPGPDLNWSATIGGANRSLYVANPQLNTVSVYDTRTNQPAGTITVGRSPRGVAASPDGTRVYVANLYDDTVSVINTSNNTVIDPPLKAGDGAYDVAVSPDGAFLYVTNAFEGTVRVLAADGGAAAQTSFSTMAMAAASPEEVTWGTVVLTGFPPGGRVLVDGEFPRWEGSVEGGTAVSFTAGAHTLHLACPGYIERAFPVSVDAGEIVTVDGQLQMEP